MKCPDDTALLVMQMAVGAVRSIADEFGGMTLSEFVVCCEAWWCTDWIGMEFFIADIVAAAGGVVVGGGGFKGGHVVVVLFLAGRTLISTAVRMETTKRLRSQVKQAPCS